MREISIWFFVGVALLVNGTLVAGAGLWEFFHPPLHPVVLFELHANVWWGLVLLILGLVACIHFSPARSVR
jgi:energy-converting hydrogenase Eha subunit E